LKRRSASDALALGVRGRDADSVAGTMVSLFTTRKYVLSNTTVHRSTTDLSRARHTDLGFSLSPVELSHTVLMVATRYGQWQRPWPHRTISDDDVRRRRTPMDERAVAASRDDLPDQKRRLIEGIHYLATRFSFFSGRRSHRKWKGSLPRTPAKKDVPRNARLS